MPRNRILILASLALLAVAAFLAVDLHRASRHEVLHQFNALQALLARQAAHEVGSVLQECAADLRFLVGLASLQDRDPDRIQQDLESHARTLDPSWTPVFTLLDEAGGVVCTTGARRAFADAWTNGFHSWSQEPKEELQVTVSGCPLPDPGLSEPRAASRFLLAMPLYRPAPASGSPPLRRVWSGTLLMAVDLEPTLMRHLSLLSPHFRAHRLWIMDQDGTIVLQSEHPEMTRENIHRVKPECSQCHVSFDYAKRMLEQRAGVAEYRLRSRPEKVAAFAPMRFANASWVVVVAVPYAQVTAFVGRTLRQTLLLVATMAAALSLAAVALHQSDIARVRAKAEAKQWQEKHLLEERIRRAEACYHTLFRHSPDGILLIDPVTTRPIDFNEAAHRRLGYSREEFARLGLADHEAATTPAAARDRVADLLRHGWEHYETRHRTKDGGVRDVEVITQTLHLGGRAVFHCIHHDVTERKRAERALAHRTAQLEALHQVNLGITSEMEPGVLLRTILTQALALFRGTAGVLYLHRPERDVLEPVMQTGQEAASPGGALKRGEALAGRVWASGAPLALPDRAPGEAGREGREPVVGGSAMGAPICWGERFVGVLEVRADSPGFFSADEATLLGLLTTQAAVAIKNAGLLDQVRQDAAIQATLLNDVNHRVKNNLMRLIEIVRLERRHALPDGAGLRAALEDLEDRLRGMEVVHTMLSTAHWHPLPLSELVTQIVTSALSGSPIRHRIQVSVAVPTEPLKVVPEQATAVALILNELATNSVKYAFRDRESGRLEVSLQTEVGREARPLIRLRYRDDGPGWPDPVLRGQGFAVGLHLIQSSVRSPLRGDLALRNDGGAVAELAFRLARTG